MSVEQFITQLCHHCGLTEQDFQVSIAQDEDHLRVNLELADDFKSIFIGSRGETLDAIELIIRMAFQQEYPDHKIVFDIGGYREQREQRMQEKAVAIAQRVLETGRDYSFGRLNSYERYLIHKAVSQDPQLAEVETVSEDTPDGRILVIRVK